MKFYEVNATDTTAVVNKTTTVYVFDFKSVMNELCRCCTLADSQSLLRSVRRAIESTIKRPCEVGFKLSGDSVEPYVTCSHYGDIVQSRYEHGLLYLEAISTEKAMCITLNAKNKEEQNKSAE